MWLDLLAHGVSLADLQRRVDADPFVEHSVVVAEILEIGAAKADANPMSRGR